MGQDERLADDLHAVGGHGFAGVLRVPRGLEFRHDAQSLSVELRLRGRGQCRLTRLGPFEAEEDVRVRAFGLTLARVTSNLKVAEGV